jgi:hypothetical protein
MTQTLAIVLTRRRWTQFSLRTLLVLPILVGLACHWAAERARRQQALTEISKIGGIIYCEGMGKYGEVDVLLTFYGFDCGTGKTFFTHSSIPFEDRKFDEAGLYHLRFVPHLVSVDLCSMKVGDQAVDHLCALSDLKELALLGSEITDENLKRLRTALPNCEIHSDKHLDGIAQPKSTVKESDPTMTPSVEALLTDRFRSRDD